MGRTYVIQKEIGGYITIGELDCDDPALSEITTATRIRLLTYPYPEARE